ncbi:MAG: fibronectin type III domain-containing protein, partial [Elusimicrobiota bacterium]
TPPVISAVVASNIGQSSATISWNTNEPSNTQVEYGTSTSYGSSTVLNASLVTAHSQGLTGLTAGTVYNYRVKSRDAAGNLAVSGNFTFTTRHTVVSLIARLISPAPDALGVSKVFTSGVIPILGSAGGPGFARYVVSFAAAPSETAVAAGPFTEIAHSQTAVSSGTLASWNASNLSGWHTVKLQVWDSSGQELSQTANVLLGNPAAVFLEAEKGKRYFFGVAIGPDGSLYAGEADSRKGIFIRKYSATGVSMAELGLDAGLWTPTGLAVDGGGNIYAADWFRNQVVKLDPAGRVIFRLGKRDAEGNVVPGSGPGEFHDPTGVAVDTAGNVYVADRKNGRIQKFTSGGAYVREFDVTNCRPLPDEAHEDHTDDHDAERCDRSFHARPWGVAVDASGNMFITDDRHFRLIKLSAAGEVLDVVGQAGRDPGRFILPKGLHVNARGEVFVTDTGNRRVQRFDPHLNVVLVFGETRSTSPLYVDFPWSAVQASDGRLYMTDVFALRGYDASGGIVSSPSAAPERAAPPADGAFRLGEVYAFPNPARSGANPTLHVEAGLADRLEIRIYDVAGTLVHETEIPGAPRLVDDGQGPQYAYEYTWDASGAPSGVYLFRVQAHKAGESQLAASGKLAVLK